MKEEIKLTPEQVEGLISRLESESLTPEDIGVLKAIVKNYLLLSQAAGDKNARIHKLIRMLFGAKTERAEKILGRSLSSGEDPGSSGGVESAPEKEPPADDPENGAAPRGHGRNGILAYTGAEAGAVCHPELKVGDHCPLCPQGKVYPFTPGVVVRITGGAPIQSKVWEIEKLRCNLCQEIFAAPLPKEAGDEKYDETASAMIPLLRYGSGLPLNRLEQLQQELGTPLPASTQWDITERTANRIYPVYDELIRQAAQGDLLYNDDTTTKILELLNVEENGRKGTFTTGIVSVVGARKIVLFRTGRKHAGENMTDLLILRDPKLGPPIQMCDALSRNTSTEFETILANCLTHARRNFVELVCSFPEECRYVIEILRDVYKNDKTAREEKFTSRQRLEYHQQMSAPLMERLRAWMNDQIDSKKVEPNSTLGKAISYMQNHWEPLTLFLRVEGAPLDNNLCEQILKRAILHRKNSLFYKTTHGAYIGDLFMSLIHTCKMSKINPFDYLVALQRHSHEVFRNPQAWLPWNYTAAASALSG